MNLDPALRLARKADVLRHADYHVSWFELRVHGCGEERRENKRDNCCATDTGASDVTRQLFAAPTRALWVHDSQALIEIALCRIGPQDILEVDTAESFKELVRLSRKVAIPLLEFFDREGVTKRVGDSRQVL